MFTRLSLRYRIALVIFVLEALMLGAVLGVTLSQSRATAVDMHAASQAASMDLLANLSHGALLTGEYADFQLYVQDVQKQPSLEHIVLADVDGHVVAGSQVDKVGLDLDQVAPAAAADWRRQPIVTEGGPMGMLAVQFSDDALSQAQARTRNLALGVGAAGMGLIALVGLAAGVALTRRLDRVTDALHRFADGDQAARAGIGGHDEVAQLSRSFDRMADSVQAQQTLLREQKDHIGLLLSSTSDAIYGVDAQGRCTFANPACVRMLGYADETELTGRVMHDLIHHTRADGSAYPKQECRIWQASRLRQSAHVDDEVHWRADGSSFPVEYRSHPMFRDGQFVGTVVAFNDTSERRRSDTELRQFKTTLDLSRDGIFIFDPATLRLRYVNDGAVEMTGWPAGDLLRMTVKEIRPDLGDAYFRDLLTPLTADGNSSLAFETEHRHRDGHLIDVHVRLQYVAPPGEAPRFVAVLRDISERRQAEQALRQLNDDLEQRVEQRTAELARAKDDAERANLAKSEFLSRMSHELRTPLNAILGFGQLLALKASEPQQVSQVREIVGAGRHLLTLIDEVLDLARVESGMLSVSPEPVALLPLLQDCLALLRPQAEPQGIRLLDASAQCDVHVRADGTRLKQVLLNLLSNAVKYNRAQGAVSVLCVAEPATEPTTLCLRIRDTGRGLDPAQCARLFTPFERLDAEERRIPGTGIGLALSKRLMALMGGQIGVDSTPGSGSTFWIRLPLDRPHAEPAAPATLALATLAAQPHSVRQDVLCIEDNPANLRLVESIFAHRPDVRLLSAIAPGLGLELARTHRPALILLDINLPDMDGYAVLQCLREHPDTRDIPVIATSANAMPRDIERGRAAGFHAYLTKPLDIARLLTLVDELLDPRPS